MPAQFIEDPTIGNALGQLGQTLMGGDMTTLRAAQTFGDIQMKNMERQKLQNEMDTQARVGQSLGDLYGQNVQAATAAPPAPTAVPSNVWGDPTTQPSDAQPTPEQQRADQIKMKKAQYYRDAIAAAIAKGDFATAQKLATIGPMDIAGKTPTDLNQREIAKASGMDISITPPSPAMNDEMARSTIFNAENA